MLLNILIVVSLVGLAIVWAHYVVEAWGASPVQALLTLLLPAYVFYWAYIRSRRANPFRWGLVTGAALLILLSMLKLG